TLLKLPEGLLVRMAGGAPLVLDGRILDARTQFLASQGAKAPSIVTLDPVSARAAAAAGLRLLDSAPGPDAAVRPLAVPGPAGPLDARLYTPEGAAGPLPGLVFFHFGGCVLGDLDTCHSFCALLARRARCGVLSGACRPAPGHRVPAAGVDARRAWRFGRGNAAWRGT